MAAAILVFDSSVTGVEVSVLADQADIERDLKMLTAELITFRCQGRSGMVEGVGIRRCAHC